jgi:hypothetical protein
VSPAAPVSYGEIDTLINWLGLALTVTNWVVPSISVDATETPHSGCEGIVVVVVVVVVVAGLVAGGLAGGLGRSLD